VKFGRSVVHAAFSEQQKRRLWAASRNVESFLYGCGGVLCGCELCWLDELFGWLDELVFALVEALALLLPEVAGEMLGAVDGVLLEALGVESVAELDVFVSDMLPLALRRELFMADPLWRDAAAPEAVPVLSGAELMSPVSLRAQPANAIRLAAKSANFFIDIPRSFPGCPQTQETLPEPGAFT
jgi:hypothetical protein